MTVADSSFDRVRAAVTRAAADMRAHPVAYLLLLALLGGAAWMRLADLQSISFLIDPAWDLIWVDAILHQHRFPLLGQMLTTGGFLGPAMLYLMAPVGMLSSDPEAFAAFFAASNVLAVLLAFYIGRRYFSLRAGLLSALLLGYNLFAISASRGIWNPFLVPVFSALLTLLLFHFFIDGVARALIGIAICLSVLLQLHAHTVVLPLYCLSLVCLLPHPRVSRLIVGAAVLVTGVVLVLPLLAFDLANDFYNARQILNGLSDLQPAALSPLDRARIFLTMNVFTDRGFRSAFLLGAGVTLVDLLIRRDDPVTRAKRLILILPAALLFGLMVIVARLPLLPRFIQSLVVPSAIVAGAALDDLVSWGTQRWPRQRQVVNAALVAAGMLYTGNVARHYAARPREYGFGHLVAIRQAARLVIDDSRSRTVARDNVFVCEDGTRDLADYGRSYGYVIKVMSRQAPQRDPVPATRYMISAFVQSDENRIGSFEGVSVYRFPDLLRFAEFLRAFPGAVCHRAVAENFPFRTG